MVGLHRESDSNLLTARMAELLVCEYPPRTSANSLAHSEVALLTRNLIGRRPHITVAWGIAPGFRANRVFVGRRPSSILV